MDKLLHDYDVNAATWFYLSLLLIIALFFRFNRIWSLRNLDLALLLSLAPGLLFVREQPVVGYVWLFVATGVLLLRLFCDVLFQRRPRTEQNLNPPGMGFLCVVCFAFLAGSIIMQPPTPSSVETVRRGGQLLNREDASAGKTEVGPTPSLFAAQVVPLSNVVASANGEPVAEEARIEIVAARTMALLAHVAVITGLLMLGHWHFGDLHLGLAMGTLYLLLPGTAYNVGEVNHVLPAALIVWAFVFYRRPMAAGGLMGLACGTLFFPFFLLPLWAAFYGRRGALRFGLALGIVGAVLLGALARTSADVQSFRQQTIGLIDWSALTFHGTETNGFWTVDNAPYRIPVVTAFLLMLAVLTVWPRRKNLEHLVAHSTAIVVATQFWYPQQGGVYLLWYLPLLLIVVFRPRLAHLGPPDLKPLWSRKGAAPAPPARELIGSGGASGRLFR